MLLGQPGGGTYTGELGFIDLIVGAVKKSRAKKAAQAQAKADAQQAQQLTTCPPGMIANPQILTVPIEQRLQAIAAGIQPCIPGAGAGGGVGAVPKPKCRFVVGTAKFPCTKSGFKDALAEVDYKQRQGVPAQLVLRWGKRKVMMQACVAVAPSGGITTATAVQPTYAVPPVYYRRAVGTKKVSSGPFVPRVRKRRSRG